MYQFLYRCGHFNLSLIVNQNISDSFLGMYSPVTFAHSLSKKSRTVSSWELCIICQISCDDTLSKASEKGKCTLFKAVGLRKDDVHRRLHDEFDSLDLIPTDRIQYHRSCYESYTSLWLGENIRIYLCKDPLNDCSIWLVSMHIL